jgi:hypothetical protein
LANFDNLSITDVSHTGNSYTASSGSIMAAGLDVSYSGALQFIQFELSQSNDDILVNVIQAGESWNFFTNDGDDAVTVSGAGGDLDAILGNLSFSAGPGTDDTLEILDNMDSGLVDYDIGTEFFNRTGMPPIGFSDFETLTLRTNNDPNVVSTRPLVGVAQILEGNDPAVAPGDVLNYDSLGACATDSGTAISSPLGGTVSYSEFEDVNVTGCATVEIPTLGEVGFAALALALGILGVLRLGSRRVQAS